MQSRLGACSGGVHITQAGLVEGKAELEGDTRSVPFARQVRRTSTTSRGAQHSTAMTQPELAYCGSALRQIANVTLHAAAIFRRPWLGHLEYTSNVVCNHVQCEGHCSAPCNCRPACLPACRTPSRHEAFDTFCTSKFAHGNATLCLGEGSGGMHGSQCEASRTSSAPAGCLDCAVQILACVMTTSRAIDLWLKKGVRMTSFDQAVRAVQATPSQARLNSAQPSRRSGAGTKVRGTHELARSHL